MPAKPNEIQINRVYEAPVKLVWEAWTDPKQAAKWWGPRGFTITTKSKDLRPGGKWIYTMHGPDGTDYPNIATYHEVVKYEKLAYDHGGTEERDKLFSVIVTFKENKGKTTMSMTMTLPTEEEAKQTKKFIRMAGGNSTWDRLAEYLETEKDIFIFHRSLDADIKSVYKMWIDPEYYTQWMGPADSKMSFMKTDVKEGGMSQWEMTTSDGVTKYGQLNYKRISAPQDLVYTQNFCNKDGSFAKLPIAAPYPDMLMTTVNLVEEEGQQTRVCVKWEIVGDATSEERKTFNDLKSIMTAGWNESFDKIDTLLTK